MRCVLGSADAEQTKTTLLSPESWVAGNLSHLHSRLIAHVCVPQNELITRLGAGGQSGRAATAEKALERMREEGLVGKPFVPKKRSFAFPAVDRMG